MSGLSELEQRIQEMLTATEQRKQVEQNHLHQGMMEFEQRHQRFTAVADRLVQNVLRPRLQKLAEHFDNARLLGCDPTGQHQCVCRFDHTPRFPATAKLELAVSRDGQCETLLVLYNLEILPVFFAFQGHDQLSFPLDRVSEEQVAAWVDEKIIGFVETYLRLETTDPYHTEDLVTDPVCGMRINKVYAAGQLEHQGQTFYFCVPECRQKFAENPSMYLARGEPPGK
jgi:YHS domain-containing protein